MQFRVPLEGCHYRTFGRKMIGEARLTSIRYGGQVMNAAMFGFGATLGADAANAAVGDMKEWWRH